MLPVQMKARNQVQAMGTANMTEGKVVSYDAESHEGNIHPDDEEDEIPFYSDGIKDEATRARLKEGDRVRFNIEGGMAGLVCVEVERLSS